MNYKLSRDGQEFGPYTLNEINHHVWEGTVLKTDYVFNGLEWVTVGQFLKDPNKGISYATTISKIANVSSKSNEFEKENTNYFNEREGCFSGFIFLLGGLTLIIGIISLSIKVIGAAVAIIAFSYFTNQTKTSQLGMMDGFLGCGGSGGSCGGCGGGGCGGGE